MNWDKATELVAKVNKQQRSRGIDSNNMHIRVLFNKGRYFEHSIHDAKLRRSMAQAVKIKVEYGNMIIGSHDKLEALVKAYNKRGFYVNINLDWI